MDKTDNKTGVGTVPRDNDSETLMLAGAQAHQMLTGAHIPHSGIDRFCVLANDIVALANESMFDGDVTAAARELESRIGGLANLKSYTDTLLVGNRKFGL